MNLEIFNLIYSLKDIKKTELVLSKDDIYIIDQFYKIVKKHIYKRGFIKAVKSYQLDTMETDMYLICDVISKEIIKKYGRN
jgi:hypothetical protein